MNQCRVGPSLAPSGSHRKTSWLIYELFRVSKPKNVEVIKSIYGGTMGLFKEEGQVDPPTLDNE